MTTQIFAALSTLALLAQPVHAFESAADKEAWVAKIDNDSERFLATGCTEPRQMLCAALRGFKAGTVPRAGMLTQPYYLGRVHSVRVDFNYSLDYGRQSALLMLKQENTGTAAYFHVLQADTPEEKAEVDAAKDNIRNRRSIGQGPLLAYLEESAQQTSFISCNTVSNTLFCGPSGDSMVLIREYKGNIHTIALGQVPRQHGSFDSAPGFFISEYELRPALTVAPADGRHLAASAQ